MSDDMGLELEGAASAGELSAAEAETFAEIPGQAPAPSRGLMSASVLMMVMTLLSAITGLALVAALSWRFGDAEHLPDLNAYWQAFRIPNFVYFLVAGGALRTGFVPVFSRYLAKGEHAKAWRTFSSTLWILGLLATLVIGLGVAFAKPLTILVAPGWTGAGQQHEYEMTTLLMRFMFPSELFMLLGGLLMGMLNAQKHFLWPAMSPILFNVFIGLAVVFAPREYGIVAVALSIPISSLLCNVVLQIPALRRRGARLLAILDFHDEGFQQALKLVLPVIFGLSVAEILTLVTSSMATIVDKTNGATAFAVADRLWKFPTRFIGAGIAIAVFAYLADNFAREDEEAYRRDFSFGIRSTMFLTVPAALIMTVLRDPIIRLLGHGLTPECAARTSDCLFWYGWGIVPLSLVYILTRAFYARRDTATAVWAGVSAVVVCLTIAMPLSRVLGLGGLALATSIANWANAGLLALLLKRKVGTLDGARIGRSLLRQLIPAGAFGAVCWYGLQVSYRLLGDQGAVAKLAAIFGPMLAATLVFVALAWLFRVEELHSAFALLGRRFRK
ncbi:MAG TPA: murein biosynthesis integral membrane protein MurJ [Armatimonadota bacterium]|jgi:putative peptidoglycan lipid II flippase